MAGRRSHTHNSIDATTVSTVLQAGTMRGGIHFHPPSLASPVIPRQLPAPPRRFAARAGEMHRLDHALGETSDAARVLVIEGQGGVGKTALALHWLHRHLDHFPDGQLHADLHGFDQSGTPAAPAAVIHGFLLGLGVPPDAIPADESARIACYRSMIAGKRLVVVLDNTANAAQAAPLLPGSSSCRAVVTSRSRLPALSIHGAETLHLGVLPDDHARDMLVQHLGRTRVEAEPAAVSTILRRCAGLPLALAIVAALAGSHDFPLASIAAELQDARLDAFDAGDPAADVRAVISWSVSTLDSESAGMFGLLGLAPAHPVAVRAAAALAGCGLYRATTAMRELERRNLVQQKEPGRFGMHELVRLYAAEQAPESAEAMTRLADFTLHSALSADHALYPHRAPVPLPRPTDGSSPLHFDDRATAMAWFTAEHEHLLAVELLLASHGDDLRTWLLSRALDTYLYRRGHIRDNVTSSRLGVTAASRLGDPLALALALRQLGRAHSRASEPRDAITCHLRALEVDDDPHTHFDLSRALLDTGDFASAATHLEQALVAHRRSGNRVGEAHALNALGRCHLLLDDLAQARSCCESALELNGDTSGRVGTLDNLGTIALRTDAPADAIARYTEALALCDEVDDRYLEARILEHLGEALQRHGEPARAAQAWQSALELFASQHRAADADRLRTRLAGGTTYA